MAGAKARTGPLATARELNYRLSNPLALARLEPIMPKKDVYHDTVRRALEADGWVITNDPYTFTLGDQRLLADPGAEHPMAAERNGRKIAVEVKSFVQRSLIRDLQ